MSACHGQKTMLRQEGNRTTTHPPRNLPLCRFEGARVGRVILRQIREHTWWYNAVQIHDWRHYWRVRAGRSSVLGCGQSSGCGFLFHAFWGSSDLFLIFVTCITLFKLNTANSGTENWWRYIPCQTLWDGFPKFFFFLFVMKVRAVFPSLLWFLQQLWCPLPQTPKGSYEPSFSLSSSAFCLISSTALSSSSWAQNKTDIKIWRTSGQVSLVEASELRIHRQLICRVCVTTMKWDYWLRNFPQLCCHNTLRVWHLWLQSMCPE